MIPVENQDLWARVNSFELDDPSSAFSFSDRLARENGWTYKYSLRAIAEYKKFMFLICVAGHPLTPSDQVDQVWHLHLLYTESYWLHFCNDILQKQIHHGPTRGGIKEADKFTDLYQKTKELYANVFDAIPPEDIWPESDTRFGDVNFSRINLSRNWIIKKPGFFKK